MTKKSRNRRKVIRLLKQAVEGSVLTATGTTYFIHKRTHECMCFDSSYKLRKLKSISDNSPIKCFSLSASRSTLRWSDPFVVLSKEQKLKFDELIDYANKKLGRT